MGKGTLSEARFVNAQDQMHGSPDIHHACHMCFQTHSKLFQKQSLDHPCKEAHSTNTNRNSTKNILQTTNIPKPWTINRTSP